ncbi:MAG: NAD(P)H-hydrate dehydratase [Coriobacteriales bacterium]|nr:NAD(P)H-hydrate dehydratase [Coriobacteriales bacterium]
MTNHELAALLPPVPHDAHKYTRGSLLVLAGSLRFPGAAVLAAQAATRTGAGYVTLAIPGPAAAAAHAHLLSVPVLAAPATEGAFAAEAWGHVRAQAGHIDALVLGPGLTVTASTEAFVRSVLHDAAGAPLLLDADALTVLASLMQKEPAFAVGAPSLLLTPHAGELRRLLGSDGAAGGGADDSAGSQGSAPANPLTCGPTDRAADGRTDDPAAARTDGPAAAQRPAVTLAQALVAWGAPGAPAPFEAVVVAKGPTTHIASATSATSAGTAPHGLQSRSLSPGTPALAKAGTGDVLSGVIGSLLAQGIAPFDAAVLGVSLHGRAGRLAEQSLGQRGTCAEDLPACLPLALKEIEGR